MTSGCGSWRPWSGTRPSAGRLSLDEFSDRVARALAAPTRHDLALVTSDLPAEPVPAQSRQLLAAFLLATVTLAVLGLLIVLGR
jgi:hypothetical protein